MSYKASETATVLVDHQSLDEMLLACSGDDIKAVLIGFNEYSKHLLNLIGEKVLAIYDQDQWKIGITFRNKEVVGADIILEANLIVVCEIKSLYGFTGKIRRLYQNQVPLFVPSRLHYVQTSEINIFEQEEVYTKALSDMQLAPASMMSREKLFFLAELMRMGLRNRGDLIEVGAYQCGSVFFLAKVLFYLSETRVFNVIDVFEKHMMHPNATMCNDEISRRLSFYTGINLLEGLADDDEILNSLEDRKFCFAHYDLGFHKKSLEFIWNRLAPGSPIVLDNYGHLAICPWDLDDFFNCRGAHITRLPWSEQGIVFKPC